VRVYLAGMGGLPWKKRNFYDFYRLDSFLVILSDEPVHKYKDFILDSGAFSYMNGRKTDDIDWDEYADRYAAFVLKKNIRNYIEIDVDRVIGLSEVERLRRRIEKKVGWKSMPVWHVGRGYDYWLKMCTDYDYVCFGAFLVDKLDSSKYPIVTKFIRDASRLNARVHGLGFTGFKWLPKLHFYSVDSSSWLAGNRYSHVCKYKDGRVNIIKKPAGCRMTNLEELAWHNFKEWLLFSNYADAYL
jgi:hypothetical protein